MLQVSFITIHPEFVRSYFDFGVFASSIQAKIARFEVINLRDYATDRHGTVDGRAYGGSDGMILRPEPLANAVSKIKSDTSEVWFPSPQGHLWSHSVARKASMELPNHIIMVCGRFGGIDQRFIDKYVDKEISLGDFVLSGGELASLAITDTILRLQPGTLGHKESSYCDSFAEGLEGNLEYPQYTRPPVFEETPVPDVLLSGNHKLISQWRIDESTRVTNQKRPDLTKRL